MVSSLPIQERCNKIRKEDEKMRRNLYFVNPTGFFVAMANPIIQRIVLWIYIVPAYSSTRDDIHYSLVAVLEWPASSSYLGRINLVTEKGIWFDWHAVRWTG